MTDGSLAGHRPAAAMVGGRPDGAPAPAPVYRTFDQSELDRQYSPSSCVADIAVYLAAYRTSSRRARERLAVRRDLAYGDGPAERLDFFPGTVPGAPLHVFVHGGYWQELSKADAAFAAPGFVARGAAFAALGYGLAPRYDLDAIVAMVRRGVRWLVDHAADLGVDPARVHLSGHCAGAQLVVLAAYGDGSAAARLPVAGLTLLSGVYDLEPVRLSYVNAAVGMDAATARRNSPLSALPDRGVPTVVARGGRETSEFARQHARFVAAARRRGPVVDLVVGHRNHFDLPSDLAQGSSPLGRAVLGQMRLAGPRAG